MKNIDVHCHLFNNEIVSWRILLDFFYSINHDRESVVTSKLKDSVKDNQPADIKGKLYLSHLLFHSSESILKYLFKKEPDTIFVPLMFDLKYAVESDDGLQAVETMRMIVEDERDRLEKFNLSNALGANSDPLLSEKIKFFNAVLDNTSKINIPAKSSLKANNVFSKSADSFDLQYNELVNLKKKYSDIIMPFIAVDPRRPSIFDRVKQAIEKDGFKGVKLYCPNGYSPLDPRLEDVFDYCVKNHIPVTAHCSYGGVATAENEIHVRGGYFKDNQIALGDIQLFFEKKITESGGIEERAYALNHPALWAEVLGKHHGLMLNLAHMGVRTIDNDTLKYEWSHHIVEMMKKYETLYTDLSCRTTDSQITSLWNIVKDADEKCALPLKVSDRVMFGTDFWLSMLSEDLKDHLDAFDRSFKENPDDLIRIKQTNPARFLNITK